MTQYRFLQDHYIAGQYIQAGTTLDISSLGLVSWTPTPDVDPLDLAAVNAFYAAGPTLCGLIRQQFINQIVARPVTYWVQQTPNVWVLTGLGANQSNYPPKNQFGVSNP